MRFMVIETFKADRAVVYERYDQQGRMMPDGLHYIDSWIERDGNRCFQLMETETPELFQSWTAKWSDLVDFEIVAIELSPTND